MRGIWDHNFVYGTSKITILIHSNQYPLHHGCIPIQIRSRIRTKPRLFEKPNTDADVKNFNCYWNFEKGEVNLF